MNFYTYKTNNNKFMIKFNYATIVKEYKQINFSRIMYPLKSFSSLKSNEDFNDKELIG